MMQKTDGFCFNAETTPLTFHFTLFVLIGIVGDRL